MNDAGFLIMHEDFLLSTATAADVEYVHITEKEKSIAEHLISRGYLRKKQCRNLKEIRKQSFYEVKLPNGFVDEIKNSDSCSKYQLSKIMGTNAYLGLSVIRLHLSLCVYLSVFIFLVFISPVAQWLQHPTRSWRVVGSNPIWGSDFSESTFLLEFT